MQRGRCLVRGDDLDAPWALRDPQEASEISGGASHTCAWSSNPDMSSRMSRTPVLSENMVESVARSRVGSAIDRLAPRLFWAHVSGRAHDDALHRHGGRRHCTRRTIRTGRNWRI